MSLTNQPTVPDDDTNPFKAKDNTVLKRIIILGLLLLVVVAVILAVLGFRQTHEKVIATRYELSTRVHYNPFYAAELLLNRQYGYSIDEYSYVNEDSYDPDFEDAASYEDAVYYEDDVYLDDELYYEEDGYYEDKFATTLLDSSFNNLVDDLPYLDISVENTGLRPTLIINSIGSNLTDEDFEQLRQWIADGGHLITFNNSDWSDSDAIADVLERLDDLTSSNATTEDIATDQELNELLEKLDAGNSFLAKLGIYAVRSFSYESEDDAINTQFDALFDELDTDINQESDEDIAHGNDSSQADTDTYNSYMRDLYYDRSISIMPLNNKAAGSDDANIIAVKTLHLDRHLNSEVFEALYADKINKLSQKKQNTTLIRTYLSNQKKLVIAEINKQTNDKESLSKSANQNTHNNVPSNVDDGVLAKEKKLLLLINSLEKLEDDMLQALFKPIDEVYLDYDYGQGRLSVIIDSNVFSNPDPNNVLPVHKVKADNGEVLQDSVLLPLYITSQSLLGDGYHYQSSLFDANNAEWLNYLTQNSDMVWILPNTDVEPLPIILWKQARFAVLGLGLLLLIWLWSLYNRFGKLQKLSHAQSYDILNYFRQVGRFGWQQDNATRLTGVAKERIKALAIEALRYQSSNTTQDSEYNFDTEATLIDFASAKNSMALHKLLLAYLREKKQLEQQQSIAGFAQDNYAEIVELITPSRLRQALAPSIKDNEHADDFTNMTQTLWVIEWLLKK